MLSRRTLLKTAALLPLWPHLGSSFNLAAGNGADARLASGLQANVLLAWGDALAPNLALFNPANLTPETQAVRFGYNNDFTAFFPINNNPNHGLLCVNHETPNPALMFPNGFSPSLRIAIEQQAVGVSVVEIKREQHKWQVVLNSPYNRRITATTPMRSSGAATLGDTMRGTLANCGGGVTPWGTYLTCEENIDMFFKGASTDALFGKYAGFFDWASTDARFDAAKNPDVSKQFGWVVEIDPFKPSAAPIKHTALGRMKHEYATPLLHQGRVVVYMSDDEAGQYCYKFMSDGASLTSGTLFAAKFLDKGQLEWLPLVYGKAPLNAANGFNSQSDVLLHTRRAAALMGATPMDRPEGIAVHPKTGDVYIALTKHKTRLTANAANPRLLNTMGHIIRLHEAPLATTGKWNFFAFGGQTKGAKVVCPDNLCFSPDGRLWIATDGAEDAAGMGDGLYACATEGAEKAVMQRLLRAPTGAEVTGISFTPNGKTLFVGIQHPGQDSTFNNPSTRFPDNTPSLPPRPALLAVGL